MSSAGSRSPCSGPGDTRCAAVAAGGIEVSVRRWLPILLLALPAARAAADPSLSAGASARLRFESVRNADWGRDPEDGSGYLLGRFMLHVDFRLDAHLRLFGELKSGLITGRDG